MERERPRSKWMCIVHLAETDRFQWCRTLKSALSWIEAHDGLMESATIVEVARQLYVKDATSAAAIIERFNEEGISDDND